MKENVIREIRAGEIPLLDDFLYEAIFIPDGAFAVVDGKGKANAPERGIRHFSRMFKKEYGTVPSKMNKYLCV